VARRSQARWSPQRALARMSLTSAGFLETSQHHDPKPVKRPVNNFLATLRAASGDCRRASRHRCTWPFTWASSWGRSSWARWSITPARDEAGAFYTVTGQGKLDGLVLPALSPRGYHAPSSNQSATGVVAPTGYNRLWHVQVRGILRAA
jgi:hypothetical protein